jgi:hypothetical protein
VILKCKGTAIQYINTTLINIMHLLFVNSNLHVFISYTYRVAIDVGKSGSVY